MFFQRRVILGVVLNDVPFKKKFSRVGHFMSNCKGRLFLGIFLKLGHSWEHFQRRVSSKDGPQWKCFQRMYHSFNRVNLKGGSFLQ